MNPSNLRRCALLSLIFALAACRAWTQTNYQGEIWALADSKKVLAAAAGITAEKYPNCDDVTVEKKMMRTYRKDGSGETQDETYTRVLTEKGRRNNRTLSLSFMLPYFTVSVPRLEIIKPDGRIVPVDVAANSKETIDESQMQMNIYDPNNKILQVNIPGVEIGDIIHSVSRLTIQRAIVENEYAEESVFEGPGFILHETYEVHAPAERPLVHTALRDEISGTVTYTKHEESGGTVHHWEVNNVPRMYDEPAMPSYEMVLQRLYVSTISDWKALSKWYWNLSKSHLDAVNPEMKEKVAALTNNAAGEMDRIKSVFYYVSKNIRYMGLTPEKDRPGFEPHDVELTFGKKYGVCRDKAALLVSMLREAGLDAYPVLISVGVKRDPEVPDPDFNHAIVSVQLHKGEYVLMDPTDENTRALLPSSDCFQSYLVCRPEGEGLQISPVPPASEHLMRVATACTLSAGGRLEAKSDLFFDGVNDDQYRNAFAHMKPDDERRFFERNLKRAMPGAKLRSLKITPADVLDMSSDLHAEIEYSVDGLTASGNGKAIVNLPWIGNNFGIVNFILDGTGLEKRKYPMETYYACGMEEGISMKLGAGFGRVISLPSYSRVDNAAMVSEEKVTAESGTLNCSRQLRLKTVEFSPSEYSTLKEVLKSLQYDQRKAPIIAVDAAKAEAQDAVETAGSPPVQSNARILDGVKQLEIYDAHNAKLVATYSKRILTYAGKIREAEIKLPFNPAFQTARLLRGVVTSKTGEKQEISAGEMNVMDAGWNASAKRYTGEKILVANMPGLEIGSTIDVSYELTWSNAPFISGYEFFQLPDEMDKKSVTMTAPAGLEIHHLASGPAGRVVEKTVNENGKQVFNWTADHSPALPAEPQLPPEWVFDSGIAYFAGDMRAYLKELNDTMLERSGERSKAAALAADLTGKTHSKTDAVKAIRDYVAKTIRFAGPSFMDLPMRELSAADTTLADGYGHAADRAILLHAMLSAAGFQPEFVMASGLPPIAEITNIALSFPLPRVFDYPLVRVEADGMTLYLNDTDQYAKPGTTSFDDHVALALSTQTFFVVHAAKDCDDRVETDYALVPGDSGATRIQVTRHFYGMEYNGRNRYFSELPPEERRRHFQEMLTELAQGAKAVGDLTTRFDVYPGIEQFTADIDKYNVLDGNFFYFDLPFRPSLFPLGADQRSLPLFIAHGGRHIVHTEIELPASFRHVVIAPGAEKLEGPDGCGTAAIEETDNGRKLSITHEFRIAPAIVPPSHYAALMKVESALGKEGNRVLLLEKD